MKKYLFNLKPVKVPKIHTKNRDIKTSIPAPGSAVILNKLYKYESRSMHGQLPIVWERADNFNIYDIKKGNTIKSLKIKNYIAHSLICYESIFSFESLITNKDTDFILNVSNDGWFGDNSLAPYQHLDALVMRSLENQRYSIRSTNTGISAVIAPNGTIESFIQYNKSGIINNWRFSNTFRDIFIP